MCSKLHQKRPMHHFQFHILPVASTPARNIWTPGEVKGLARVSKATDAVVERGANELLCLEEVLSGWPVVAVDANSKLSKVGKLKVWVTPVVEFDRPLSATATCMEKIRVIAAFLQDR